MRDPAREVQTPHHAVQAAIADRRAQLQAQISGLEPHSALKRALEAQLRSLLPAVEHAVSLRRELDRLHEISRADTTVLRGDTAAQRVLAIRRREQSVVEIAALERELSTLPVAARIKAVESELAVAKARRDRGAVDALEGELRRLRAPRRRAEAHGLPVARAVTQIAPTDASAASALFGVGSAPTLEDVAVVERGLAECIEAMRRGRPEAWVPTRDTDAQATLALLAAALEKRGITARITAEVLQVGDPGAQSTRQVRGLKVKLAPFC